MLDEINRPFLHQNAVQAYMALLDFSEQKKNRNDILFVVLFEQIIDCCVLILPCDVRFD